MKRNAHDELERLKGLAAREEAARSAGRLLVAGVDEAGRGPLAGPVVAAAVALPHGYYPYSLDDSKKMPARTREALYAQIIQKAVAWGVGFADAETIDSINILNATKRSMKIAVDALSEAFGAEPSLLLVDAVYIPGVAIDQEPIIKGDSLCLCIAAASVVAKVTRDRMMQEFDAQYPEYGFGKHKGYGTAQHRDALRKHGPSPIHRRTFIKGFLR
jgi:ribonuclease HII